MAATTKGKTAKKRPERFREFCPFCGSLGQWRDDRKGHPFLGCRNCRSRIFPYGQMTLTGVECAQDLIRRIGLRTYQKLFQQRLAQDLEEMEGRLKTKPDRRARGERFREFCPICGEPGGWKDDKNGHPYAACRKCRCRLFPRGHIAIIGTVLLSDLVRRYGLSRFRKMYQTRFIKSIHG